MKKWLLSFSLILCLQASAQFSVRLVVTDIATRKNEEVYVAGNFNNWNPKDENFKLKPFGGNRKSIVIKDIAAGNYAFKFTRGGFDKVECMSDGRDIADRVVEVNADISFDFTIAGWKDDYPERPKKYTASPQVKIIDTSFFIPQLNRNRRIWVYLPKGYGSTDTRYPVLYMQDGQNLFNEQTAAFGEWGVDECLDTLQKQLNKPCIIVAIDHGGAKRGSEYNPYDTPQFGKGEGKEYASFLVQTLKPFIDTKYKTKKAPENTFIAGSSLGGLISLYTVMQYPDVFGSAGVLSPAFWIAPNVYQDAEKTKSDLTHRFYLYAGSKESASLVNDLQKMSDILQKRPNYQIRKVVNPLGQHNETYWRQEFADFYKWLMN